MHNSLDLVKESFPLRTPEQIDRDKSVIIDGQSILSCKNFAFHRPVYSSDEIMIDTAAANLIQNIVIYEQLVVDSLLLVANKQCRELCRLFPSTFIAMRISNEIRDQITKEVTAEVPIDEALYNSSISVNNLVRKLFQNDTEGVELYQQANNIQKMELPETPRKVLLDLISQEYGPVPSELQDTNKSAIRAHFYLELSRKLELYFSPHPTRTEYFSSLIKNITGYPELIINQVDQKVLNDTLPGAILKIDLKVPPVADWIIRQAKKKQTDLITATLDARNSKNAREFRKWCSEISYQSRNSRGDYLKIQKLMKPLNKAIKTWTEEDFDEDIKRNIREININAIPAIGWLFSFTGSGKYKYSDPKLMSNKPYLLFLNDLYRTDS